jgi:hypothetical protein
VTEFVLSATEFLERVEQMLDALFVPNLSANEFAEGCSVLESFLATHGSDFSKSKKLDDPTRERMMMVIDRLGLLQKRAEIRAAMPSEIQKYIADQND